MRQFIKQISKIMIHLKLQEPTSKSKVNMKTLNFLIDFLINVMHLFLSQAVASVKICLRVFAERLKPPSMTLERHI